MKNETRADKKFHRVLREYYRNELFSSNGKRVTDRERAIAIAFSEARRIDPRYHITKHANGTKIKIDNTLQIVFEDAWQHYLNYIASTRENTKPLSFEQWLRTTNEGLKYNKRMAQLIRYNEIIVEPQMNSRGSKIVGASHDDGGVRGHIRETHEPIEVEGGELIITKNVGKIKQHITCHGEPEGIASRINELSGGDKISNAPATCLLKTEIMKRGKKIKQFIGVDDESKIKRQIEREQQLKNNEMENIETNRTSLNDNLIKINEHDDFKIVCFLKSRNFDSLKVFCVPEKNIYIYKTTLPQLIEFLDKYDIHYSEFESQQEFYEFITNQLPSRIKNKLQ